MSKQFNIKGISGLYLSYKPEITLTDLNYRELLLENYDFFPNGTSQYNLYDLKNAKYENPSKLIGSNSTQKSNSLFKYSEIKIKNELIANKIYYNTFKFYFRFYGSTLNNYFLPGLSSSVTKKLLNRLRVEVFVDIGSNSIPMELSNLEKYDGSTWTAVTSGDTVGSFSSIEDGNYGIELSNDFVTDTGTVDGIHMAYTGTTQMDTLFNGYKTAPDGYNFRVDAAFPDFEQISNNGKDYKITVKYFNIGVPTTGIYATTRAVELMSNTFVIYKRASEPQNLTPA